MMACGEAWRAQPAHPPPWGEGLALHGTQGGVEGAALQEKTNPTLVAPAGHAGAAEID